MIRQGEKKGEVKEEEGEEEEDNNDNDKILDPERQRQGTRKAEATLFCVVSSKLSQLHRENLS